MVHKTLHLKPIHVHLWILIVCLSSRSATAGFLNAILGVPTDCIHQNVIRQCKLSFACWLQGGKHVKGCGGNKWLFSCCVVDNELVHNNFNSLKKITTIPKRIMLKRRDENEIFQFHDCGVPRTYHNTIQKRIIGGRPARFAEFPWQAHIRISEYQCGGALVSRSFVATAAHCIQRARLQDIAIFLGELDTQNSGYIDEPFPAEKHRVSQKIIHPRFQFRMTQPDRYDIALLKLTKPAGFSNHILPICLPNLPINLIGKKGTIAGWGKTEANLGHTGTNILQSASVPIINAIDCIRWHEMKQINVELYHEMFCAGHPDGNQDACLGDSGGPLIIKDRGRFTLIGITSAGFGCGVDHQPGIYHNVQKTSRWIQDVIIRNI